MYNKRWGVFCFEKLAIEASQGLDGKCTVIPYGEGGGSDRLDAEIHFWYEGKMYNLVSFYGRPMTLIRLISNQRFLKSSLGLIWKWSHWMRPHLGLIAGLVVHPLAFFLILMLNHMCAPITSNAKVMEHIKGGGGGLVHLLSSPYCMSAALLILDLPIMCKKRTFFFF